MSKSIQNGHEDIPVLNENDNVVNQNVETSKEELVTETPVKEKEKPKPSDTQNGETDFSIEMIEKSMNNVASGQVVDGTVVGGDDKEILIDIGCKSEASIAIHEFPPNNIPQKGDVIKVYVVSREGREGKPILSKKRADFISNIIKMREAYRNNETITGKILRRVKGGMIAEILGVEAFLPGSQIAIKNIPNLDTLINKDVELKIVKLDEERKNIIVSRKRVLEEEINEKREKLKDIIQIGAELDGEVKNITDFGAFVDLGGVDGLLFITDMSWGRVEHPSDMLNLGDKIKVKVLGYDEENFRVSLGLKQLVPHPWENIEAKYVEGTKVTGKVVNVTPYGAFVELETGVEALIHVSEMSWTKKISNPTQILQVGDTVSAIVLVVSKEKQRISLGMKQMYPNPWLTVEERYPAGTIMTRPVKNLTTFGVFVEIEPDIDGLVHISDISWTKRIYHPKEILKRGQEIEVVVLSVDKLLHRVALGMKQLQKDPWESITQNLPVNTEVVGKVSKCIPKGILVEIPYEDTEVEGFVPISHLALQQIDKTEDAFSIGEELNMKIIEIDTDNRRLILSVKAWFFSREKELLNEYQKAHSEAAQNSKKMGNKKKQTQDETTPEDQNYGYGDKEYNLPEETIAQPSKTKSTIETTPTPEQAPEPTPETQNATPEKTNVAEVTTPAEVTETTEVAEIATETEPKPKKTTKAKEKATTTKEKAPSTKTKTEKTTKEKATSTKTEKTTKTKATTTKKKTTKEETPAE